MLVAAQAAALGVAFVTLKLLVVIVCGILWTRWLERWLVPLLVAYPGQGGAAIYVLLVVGGGLALFQLVF